MIVVGTALPGAGSAQSQRIESRDYQPMVWGDWLVTAGGGIGFLYNSNLYGSSRNIRAGYGSALTADIGAIRSDGVHTTSLYAAALAGLYAGNAGANTYSGSLGLSHTWSIAPDLTWAANIALAFGQNTLNDANTQNGVGGVYDKPQPYLTGNFGTTLTKELKDFIIDVGGSVNSQFYGDQKNTTGAVVSTGSSDNGRNYQLNTRVSYKISPDLRLFVQPSYNWERYRQSINDNEGYTLTGGLSIGGGDLLIGGDVYAGWQSQTYPNAFANRTNGAPTYGGSLWWVPTRDIRVTAVLSQSFGIGSPVYLPNVPASVLAASVGSGTATSAGSQPIVTVPAPAGTPPIPQDLLLQNNAQSRTTTAGLGLSYDATNRLKLGSTFAWSHSSAVFGAPANDTYTAILKADYLLTNTWSVTANYGFDYVDGGRILQGGEGSYNRNLVALGFRGRF
jgi:hypothetical protein